MKIKFFKMHAQGNDYIYVDFLEQEFSKLDFVKLSRDISARRFGVGSDGLILIKKSYLSNIDAEMIVYNADGSIAKMCGSALRCVVAYLGQKLDKNEVFVDTASGVRRGFLELNDGKLFSKTDIGKPSIVDYKQIKELRYSGIFVDMGNPHWVSFIEDLSPEIVLIEGPKIEYAFSKRVNVNFAKIISYKEILLRTWERGSGATYACGTGACATVFAGYRTGLLSNKVVVKQFGGNVIVEYDDETGMIYLNGEVHHVFSGEGEFLLDD